MYVWVCTWIHLHAFSSSWLNNKSYLLGTVPGISLWIVQLCRSGMATEPRHCTQKYPSWNHMQHRFWCGTETNITSKVNALLNTMHLQGWCLIAIKQLMSSLLTISICKPQKAKSICLHVSKNYSYVHRKEQALEVALDVLSGLFYSLLFKKWEKKWGMNGKKTLWCSEKRKISTEWHSLKRGFKSINRFLVPLAWDSGEKWSFVAVDHEQVHLRRRSSLVGNCVGTTTKPHAVFAYLDARWCR